MHFSVHHRYYVLRVSDSVKLHTLMLLVCTYICSYLVSYVVSTRIVGIQGLSACRLNMSLVGSMLQLCKCYLRCSSIHFIVLPTQQLHVASCGMHFDDEFYSIATYIHACNYIQLHTQLQMNKLTFSMISHTQPM